METDTITIDKLIDIVSRGGYVRTGVDVFNKKGVLLIEKNISIRSINPLLVIKKYGVYDIPINLSNSGGVWDESGKPISFTAEKNEDSSPDAPFGSENLEKKIKEINAQKKEAAEKYIRAKKSIVKVISDIKKSGGEFEVAPVEETVTDILNFIAQNNSAFFYLSKEIFSYDDYLYNHSVNTCTIGTAILIQFNEKFGEIINNYLSTISVEALDAQGAPASMSFIYYLPEELHDIALGYFLHDLGKVLIPAEILNKKGNRTESEFELIKKHSFEKGIQILEKNNLKNPFLSNTVGYHHSRLFQDEKGCYPNDKHPIELPPYVKICKLADIYDAMTSKRCYKEAQNPVGVVTEIFRKYANKDRILQFILRSFIKIVGIYPPGSVLYLKNGQMAYVLDSQGPILIPFTDPAGSVLKSKSYPIDMNEGLVNDVEMGIDRRRPLKSPVEAYDFLPSYLKSAVQ